MVDVISVRMMISDMFEQIIELFVRVFSEFGAWDWFFGGFTIFVAYRFLLVPMIGGSVGSSDKAKKTNKKEERGKNG